MEALYFYTNLEICFTFLMMMEPSYLKMDKAEFDRLYNATAPTTTNRTKRK
jgi:hypothetical protein